MKQLKTHSIEQSRLYRIGTKRDLARLVGVDVPELKRLRADSNYRPWWNKKGRLIEEPLPTLDRIQKKLHAIIRRIETPQWLKSGKKGVRSQDNALLHCGEVFLINVDIEHFFQSTKREYVYRCFEREFGMSSDVASILADFLTYDGHIPTGTSTSQDIAYWAYKPTFERIHKLSKFLGIEMSLWVDDLTFSRPSQFPKNWTSDINKNLKRVDLKLKTKKTKRYSRREYKTVTGTAISPQGVILVRNAKRKEILDILGSRRVEELSLKEAKSLLGKLSAQRQNEPDFFSSMYDRCKSRIKGRCISQ